jgi:ELWxxDGT repeat protein
MVPDDSREIVQAASTSETIYFVTDNLLGWSETREFYLNSTDHRKSHASKGYSLGSSFSFGNANEAPSEYPFFTIRNDNAIFSAKQYSYRFLELHGKTGKTAQLTSVGFEQPPVAVWTGAHDRTCFAALESGHGIINICYLDPASQSGFTVAHSVSFAELGPDIKTGIARAVDDKLLLTVFSTDRKKSVIIGTDGTSTGTQILNTDSGQGVLDVSMVKALGECFFNVQDRYNYQTRSSLYISNGTTTGTRLIDANIPSLLPDGYKFEWTQSSSTLYWLSPYTDNHITYSDGVTTGYLPREENWDHSFSALTWINDKLYISRDWLGAIEVSDGRSTPVLVPDIPMRSIYATAKTTTGTYIDCDNGIYFMQDELADAQLVNSHARTDAGAAHHNVFLFQDKVVYDGRNQDSSEQLWSTNLHDPDTPRAMTRFNRIPQSSNPGHYEVASNVVYFRNTGSPDPWEPEPYKTDGTAGGSAPVSLHDPVWLGEVPGGMLFHDNSRDPITGDVWTNPSVYFFNGSSFDPTKFIQSTAGDPPTEPVRMFTIGDKCYFGGAHYGSPMLYASDSNLPGTIPVAEWWDVNLEAPLYPIGVAGNRGLFYARNTNTATITYEIWSTDGTEAGTMKIAESATPPTKGAAVAGGKVVFGASIEGSLSRLVVSDGSAEGTKFLHNINSTAPISPSRFESSGGKAFFIVKTLRVVAPGYQTLLCVTDGTEDGITGSPVIPADSDMFAIMGNRNGGAYLCGIVSGTAYIIYSNGSRFGTRTISTLPLDAQPQLLGDVNGYMYIAVTTPELGRELYRTVGHTGGLELVQDFAPGPDSGAVMTDAAVFGNKLIFAADPHDGLTGTELHYIEVLDSNINDWQIY